MLAVAAAVALAALAIGAFLLTRGESGISGPPPPPALADAVPFDGRSPREPAAEGTRVLVALPRPALGSTRIRDPAAQRRYVASLRDESRALRSALGARGVQLSHVVTFERTFDGFAATVRTSDLARLDSLGVRVRPVRRFYPATSEPVRIPGVGVPGAPPSLGGVPVAVLASGVDARHPLLTGRLDRGRDVIDTDNDPAPARDPRGGRRESSGTALAGVLVAAGERVLPIRVAGAAARRAGDGAGGGRAVGPAPGGPGARRRPRRRRRHGRPRRRRPRRRERAVRGLRRLGRDARRARRRRPRHAGGRAGRRRGGRRRPAGHRRLARRGARGAHRRRARRPGGRAARPAHDRRHGRARRGAARRRAAAERAEDRGPSTRAAAPPRRSLRGRIAVVEAGNAPVARAAAAAAAGARAVLLAEPRRRRPLPALPGGRLGIPVVGVTGAGAQAALAARDGTTVEVGERGRSSTWPARSGTSCRRPNPRTSAPGSATVLDSGSLPRYLETFDAHRRGHADPRRLVSGGQECAQDLAADGAVYAEGRYAPEQHLAGGLTLDGVVEAVNEGFARRRDPGGGRTGTRRVAPCSTAMRHAADPRRSPSSPCPIATPASTGFDIAGAEAGSPDPAPGCLRVPAPGERPFHDPRGGGLRPALDLGGESSGVAPTGWATGCASSTTSTSPATAGAARPARGVRPGQRIPLEMCPCRTSRPGRAVHRRAPDRPARRLRFRVTLNTDNRLMSDTSMSKETGLLREHPGGPRGPAVGDDQRDEVCLRPLRRATGAHRRRDQARVRRPAVAQAVS